jgi:hypothetical protein
VAPNLIKNFDETSKKTIIKAATNKPALEAINNSVPPEVKKKWEAAVKRDPEILHLFVFGTKEQFASAVEEKWPPFGPNVVAEKEMLKNLHDSVREHRQMRVHLANMESQRKVEYSSLLNVSVAGYIAKGQTAPERLVTEAKHVHQGMNDNERRETATRTMELAKAEGIDYKHVVGALLEVGFTQATIMGAAVSFPEVTQNLVSSVAQIQVEETRERLRNTTGDRLGDARESYERKLEDAKFAAEEERAVRARAETEEDPKEKETPDWKKVKPKPAKK